MWEEDPRWQQAHYRFLLWSVGVIGVVVVLISALNGDWDLIRYYFVGLGVVLGVLCTYAAIVWTVAHSAMFLNRLHRRVFHGNRDGSLDCIERMEHSEKSRPGSRPRWPEDSTFGHGSMICAVFLAI